MWTVHLLMVSCCLACCCCCLGMPMMLGELWFGLARSELFIPLLRAIIDTLCPTCAWFITFLELSGKIPLRESRNGLTPWHHNTSLLASLGFLVTGWTWSFDQMSYLLGEAGVWSDTAGIPVLGVAWPANCVLCAKFRLLLLIPLTEKPSASAEHRRVWVTSHTHTQDKPSQGYIKRHATFSNQQVWRSEPNARTFSRNFSDNK